MPQFRVKNNYNSILDDRLKIKCLIIEFYNKFIKIKGIILKPY